MKIVARFSSSNKVITIKNHKTYIMDYTVINLPGFFDNNMEILLQNTTRKEQETDYSINEFLATHYSIYPSGKPLFNAFMGP
jgi:hypothetical protein